MSLFPFSKTAALVMQLLDAKTSTESAFENKIFKPKYDFVINSSRVERCTPEDAGIPSFRIKEFLNTIASDKALNMHSITVARNGKILCEASFGTQKIDIWKHSFSACKSIVALAIGILIDDKILSLDEKIVDIFSDKANMISKIKLKTLCVEDLLTMRSSVLFSEADSMTELDWVSSFLASSTKGTVGKTFRYNSLNSYILSAIVTKKTGKTLSEFLDERLFGPLGIKDYYWEKCPLGIDIGGWGLYIRPEDFAKIGLLVVNGGVYSGQRIVSEEYVGLATANHVDIVKESDRFDYGYQIWVGKNTNTFLFNGMLGQNVWGNKSNGVVIVSNAGNGEMFQEGNFFKYLEEYFSEDFPEKIENDANEYIELKKDIALFSAYNGIPQKTNRLKKFLQKLFSNHKNKKKLAHLSGKSYSVYNGDHQSVGILPIIVQTVENCYSKGFVGISFEKQDGVDYMTYEESDLKAVIPIDFDNPVLWNLDCRGNNFAVYSKAVFTKNEDGLDVLIITLDFLETASTRIIKIFFEDEENIIFEQKELPNQKFLIDLANEFLTEYEDKPIIGFFLEKFGSEFIEYKIEKIFNSRLNLKSK